MYLTLCFICLVLLKTAPDIANNLSTIKDLRESADDRYIIFLKIMAEPLVGSRVWRGCFQNVSAKLDDILTSSNEAFLLFCCENYATKWLSLSTGSQNASVQDVRVHGCYMCCIVLTLMRYRPNLFMLAKAMLGMAIMAGQEMECSATTICILL